MKRIALLFLLIPNGSMAEHPMPPIPEGGLHIIQASPCIDDETGQEGYCVLGDTRGGQVYLVFSQDNNVHFIRQVFPDHYETIWTSDTFNTF